MTAEIAIMNKEAIALAADSAVTISQKAGQKIFTSANKIFALSKYAPVGIMIYGSATFMGIPWETIVKIYNNNLGKKRFDTLKEYADDFINFFNQENQLTLQLNQDKYIKKNIYTYFNFIRGEILQKTDKVIREKKEIKHEDFKKIVEDTIEEYFNIWRKEKILPSIPKTHIDNIIEKYKEVIEKIINKIFEKIPISEDLSEKLTKMAGSLFAKTPDRLIPPDVSWVVVAGFGENDIFPSLQETLVEGVASNVLKYKIVRKVKIDLDNNASIIPFAQREMVYTFMEGVAPDYEDEIKGYLFHLISKYPNIIIEGIRKLDKSEKNSLKKKLRSVSKKIFEQYVEKLDDYRQKTYVAPVLNVVSILPKDELASMAESLVNLTSFKKRVTMEIETVGGPTDVAIISKGDGFIWIKRKHYFDSSENPQYFRNHSWEIENEKREK